MLMAAVLKSDARVGLCFHCPGVVAMLSLRRPAVHALAGGLWQVYDDEGVMRRLRVVIGLQWSG